VKTLQLQYTKSTKWNYPNIVYVYISKHIYVKKAIEWIVKNISYSIWIRKVSRYQSDNQNQ